jgi:hypothetical protein
VSSHINIETRLSILNSEVCLPVLNIEVCLSITNFEVCVCLPTLNFEVCVSPYYTLNQLIEFYEIGVNIIPPEATQTSPQTREISSVMAVSRTCEMNVRLQPSSYRTLKWCVIITIITFWGLFSCRI